MAGNVLEFTDATFQSDVLENDKPVLVDFWAPWCGPCKMIAPTIAELANDFGDQVAIGKVNTDENPQTATDQQISAIPTVILFKGGQVVEKFVGVTTKEKFSAALNGQL
ncbi:MAG: thioredoxin [Planctomycetaceae bacterium]|nr:thioredoxin [Planctomycetaceae bacterium]